MNERKNAESVSPKAVDESSKNRPSSGSNRTAILKETSNSQREALKFMEKPKPVPVSEQDKRRAEAPGSSKETMAARESLVRHHLSLAGISGGAVEQHLAGWDLTKPVYERRFDEGERLTQHSRNTTSEHQTTETGKYFGLPGEHKMGQMGVGSGLGGRSHQEFVVARPAVGLEGTAAPMNDRKPSEGTAAGGKDSKSQDKLDLRGAGGATQVFFADSGKSCLRPANDQSKER